MQQGERFSVLDPPSLPSKPDFPNRLEFCAVGLGVGFALGLALAGGFEFMDDRLHTEKEIKSLLPDFALSLIFQRSSSPADEQNSRRKLALGGGAASALVVGAILAGILVLSFLHS